MIKKYLPLLIIGLTLTGCSLFTNPDELKNEQTTPNNFVFKNESYTLTLPASYETEGAIDHSLIKPEQANNFPAIKLSGASGCKENPSIEDILETEQTILTLQCEQTDGCGKIIEWEPIEINETTALKFTVNYQGRGLDNPDGYINEYFYSVPILRFDYDEAQNKYYHTCFERFSISANDQENPEQQAAVLDSIMQTLTFEQSF